jgi:hypothetical protein
MSFKPEIPTDQTLPEQVGEWGYKPDSSWNGLVWAGEELEVVVFAHVNDTVRVAVVDTRVSGFDSKHTVTSREITDIDQKTGNWWGVEKAVAWMKRHDPKSWNHPAVDETVFDAPKGFEVAHYWIEQRETIIVYEQPGGAIEMAGRGRSPKTEPGLDTRKYLYVKVWDGSGNATVALAPWDRSHDHEMTEVVETPEECGLDIALKMAREWVAEQTGKEVSQQAGQSGLEMFC